MSASKKSLALVAIAPKEKEEVSDFTSLNFWLELTEMDLVLFHWDYQIPPKFQIKVSGPNGRACSPPLGQMSLCKECFQARLILRLHLFFINFLQFFDMSLYLLVPNSWWHIYSLNVVYMLAGVEPTIYLFCSFFTFKRHPDLADGSMYRLARGKTSHHWSKALLPPFMSGRIAFYLFPKLLVRSRNSSTRRALGVGPWSIYLRLVPC